MLKSGKAQNNSLSCGKTIEQIISDQSFSPIQENFSFQDLKLFWLHYFMYLQLNGTNFKNCRSIIYE